MSAVTVGTELPPLPGSAEAKARTRRAWFGYLAMIFGNFMAILDIQIVASSINQLQAGLSASADEIQWVQTSYLIAEVIAIPLSGYLSRMLSTRIYFVICALGFMLASAACATAWNLESMIVFRVIQGFMGGGMIPTTSAAMFAMFPPEKRVLPQILFGMASTLAPSIGPTVGGYLTQSFSWHWLFLINVIPGLLVSAAVWNLVRIDKPMPELLKTIDLWGLAFLAVFLGSFEYFLDEGPRNDWFAKDSVAICAVTAVLGGTLFFWRSFTAKNPIVDLRAFGNRNFAIGTVLASALGMGLYTLIYLTPLFLGQVRGYNSLQIGQVMIVQGAAMFFTAPLAGKLLKVISLRTMVALGLSLAATGAWLNGHLTADWGALQFALPQVLRGSGFLLCFFSMTNIALGTLPPAELKNASGLFNVMRNIGGAIGLASVNSLINSRTWLHWQMLGESVQADHPAVRDAMTAGRALTGSDAGAMSLIARQMQQQVAVMTYSDMFTMIAGVLLVALLLLPFITAPKHEVPADAAH
ncbi:DHA2 family efflux MFS transporter permease subunit [Nevskia sp.]|uniref:DHA2 family efflux MFS transporter permease subunit n=1 Tax=Nevskia sp. TaxID=1929292 RepID=UPI0025EC75E3|nr:DHA2 family efflux MFS transporter permease subunit [Nevskia sp.]